MGVSDNYLRFAVGLEHIDHIVADLERGFAASHEFAQAKE
jgi:cystathionine beta-lyase/cystathionine gamma-synthase